MIGCDQPSTNAIPTKKLGSGDLLKFNAAGVFMA